MSIQTEILKRLPPAKDVNLSGDMSRQEASLVMLHRNLFKKFSGKDISYHAKKQALDKFLQINETCFWSPDPTSYYHEIVMRGRAILFEELHSGPDQASRISLRSAIDNLLPGPGSSLGTKHTDFVSKLFHSEVSVSSLSLWLFYYQQLGETWREAEDIRLTEFGPAVEVDASKLNFAAKESEIARVINTEANIDMMFQKGIGTDMEGVLKQFYSIDLSTQPTVNRFLAKMGSLGWMKYSTMDLRSYSDTISYDFVKFYFPPHAFQTMDTVRSKVIELPHEFGGGSVKLNIFSTMGNGFTFPMQTLILASLLKAVYEAEGLPTNCNDAPHFSVFGDDVICLDQVFHKVMKVFEYCGFSVNEHKSFSTGSFRESCGEDYFKGQNIRSIYCKRFLNDSDTYSLFNRLARWSCVNGVDLSDILIYLYGLAKRKLAIPFDRADIGGFKLPLSFTSQRANRWGLVSYRHLVPRVNRRTYICEDARLLVGILGGYVEGGGLSVRRAKGEQPEVRSPRPAYTTLRSRSGNVRMCTKKGSTSSWDFIPFRHLTIAAYELALWRVYPLSRGLETPEN